MTNEMREALREYLRENMTVSIDVGPSWEMGGGYRAEVTLSLEGEVFASDTSSFSLESN